MMKLKSGKRPADSQRGATAVEMMIIMPVLLLLLYITVEFGRLFNNYNELTKAVRNGARYASENALDVNGVVDFTATDQDNTKNMVVYANPAGTGTQLLPNFTSADVTLSTVSIGTGTTATNNVTVQASWIYQTLLGTSIPMFVIENDSIDISNISLETSITMRIIN